MRWTQSCRIGSRNGRPREDWALQLKELSSVEARTLPLSGPLFRLITFNPQLCPRRSRDLCPFKLSPVSPSLTSPGCMWEKNGKIKPAGRFAHSPMVPWSTVAHASNCSVFACFTWFGSRKSALLTEEISGQVSRRLSGTDPGRANTRVGRSRRWQCNAVRQRLPRAGF